MKMDHYCMHCLEGEESTDRTEAKLQLSHNALRGRSTYKTMISSTVEVLHWLVQFAHYAKCFWSQGMRGRGT